MFNDGTSIRAASNDGYDLYEGHTNRPYVDGSHRDPSSVNFTCEAVNDDHVKINVSPSARGREATMAERAFFRP
jgi:hypothetical protein